MTQTRPHLVPPAAKRLPPSGLSRAGRTPAGTARSGRVPESHAAIAHDVRNLLASLDLYCDLLAGPGVLTPRFRHYAEDLRRVRETGARLVASLDAGALPELSRHPFPAIEDLGAEVMGMRELLQALAGPEVRLEIECAPAAGAVRLNSEDLLRILFNLIANAVEAMHDAGKRAAKPGNLHGGTIRITVQQGEGASFLPASPSPARTILLSVQDNGPGVPPEALSWIFTPGFSTRDGNRSGQPTARGMGLAIVQELVKMAGGAVRARSGRGGGACFDITLPVQATPPPSGGCTPENEAGPVEISSPSEEKGA